MPHLAPLSPLRPAARPARAFTLIELLTVIAIIGILAAIIIPTVGKVRDTAKASACASNLRQLAAACLLYANENRNQMVPIRDADLVTWRIKIEPYIGSRRSGTSILICPSDSITEYPLSSGTGEWPASYGLNYGSQFVGSNPMLQYGTQVPASKTLSHIKEPSRMIMMSDIGRGTGDANNPSTWVEDRTTNSVSEGFARFPWGGTFNLNWSVWPRHGSKSKANAAFYDGHVKSLDLIADLKDRPNGDANCLFDNH